MVVYRERVRGKTEGRVKPGTTPRCLSRVTVGDADILWKETQVDEQT